MSEQRDTRDLHVQVAEARDRILAADPGAYSGFVTDTAIRAVARRQGVNWRYVLRAYRAEYPRCRSPFAGFPVGARHPSDEAKAAA